MLHYKDHSIPYRVKIECFATSPLVVNKSIDIKISPKSLLFGEIGNPDDDLHCSPLEVNSGSTGSIWDKIKPLSSLLHY